MKLSHVKDFIINKIHKSFFGFDVVFFWKIAESSKVITSSMQEKNTLLQVYRLYKYKWIDIEIWT